MFFAPRVIAAKRDGRELSPEEIRWFLSSYVQGQIPDYQAAAFLMAVFFRGMTPRETLELTRAMVGSGRALEWGPGEGPLVDKHSTGGVGDKISLVVAPLVACLGARVPMLSGRALGHTGGTLDKLQSIPGFRTQLSPEEFRGVVLSVGCAIAGQTEDMVPGDRKLYALRDATATVESVPLIAASIASKKIAEGTMGLVLDVKCGQGAFMKTPSAARELAHATGALVRGFGRKYRALITNMDEPLGNAVGNAVEVAEAVEVLRGKGPGDVRELSLQLAAHMVEMAGIMPRAEARGALEKCLASGQALERFRDMIQAQGGDPHAIEKEDFALAPHEIVLRASRGGYVARVDALKVGWAATYLGAGRVRKEDPVDPRAGILIHKKCGEPAAAGDVLFTLRAHQRERMEAGARELESAVDITRQKPPAKALVLGIY